MIPPFSILTGIFPNSFCFYEPKSIVSGDFYWISMRNNRLIIVCADATGHGVPGAFMSLLGISFLNKIVNEKGFVSPATILNRLRMNIINHLNQSGSGQVAGDGLDLSLVSIDIDNRMLEFSGAMNPVYILRNHDFIELKGDRMPVGFFDNEDRPFSTISFSIKQNDQLFMFTDGYYDQFGGTHAHKMKTHRFKDILLACAGKKPDVQHNIIKQGFYAWKNNQPQVDDVLVLGITFN
jgi:serine phosphatase RsbU (regulator of sigma subunit)